MGTISFNSAFPQLIHHAGARRPPLHVFLILLTAPGSVEQLVVSDGLPALESPFGKFSFFPPYTTILKAFFFKLKCCVFSSFENCDVIQMYCFKQVRCACVVKYKRHQGLRRKEESVSTLSLSPGPCPVQPLLTSLCLVLQHVYHACALGHIAVVLGILAT